MALFLDKQLAIGAQLIGVLEAQMNMAKMTHVQKVLVCSYVHTVTHVRECVHGGMLVACVVVHERACCAY